MFQLYEKFVFRPLCLSVHTLPMYVRDWLGRLCGCMYPSKDLFVFHSMCIHGEGRTVFFRGGKTQRPDNQRSRGCREEPDITGAQESVSVMLRVTNAGREGELRPPAPSALGWGAVISRRKQWGWLGSVWRHDGCWWLLIGWSGQVWSQGNWFSDPYYERRAGGRKGRGRSWWKL